MTTTTPCAGPAFVLAERVRGGLVGARPSPTDLDDGDPKRSADFRDIHATVLEQVLGTDAGKVLDGHSGRLDRLLV